MMKLRELIKHANMKLIKMMKLMKLLRMMRMTSYLFSNIKSCNQTRPEAPV